MNENSSSTMSFDRMRNMLMRAAEVRESEQQQIFDALDEIHARLSPVESLGSVRKRLSELPDRTEVSVLAERLDETLSRLEAQETAITGLGHAVESVVDKLARPFAQLDGRLDGVAGRFEGVAGRMDGLEDKLAHIHKRLDDLDLHLDKQDGKLDTLPRELHVPLRERIDALETTLRGRVDEVGEGVHEHLDGTRDALHRSITESGQTLTGAVDQARGALGDQLGETRDTLAARLDEATGNLRGGIEEAATNLRGGLDEARQALREGIDSGRDALAGKITEARTELDPSSRFDALAERLTQLTDRLDQMSTRLDTVENGLVDRLGTLAGNLERGLAQVSGTMSDRPDADALLSLVRAANEESEQRHAGQLDEAMATFAELILGGAAPAPTPPPTALPRQQRRARGPKQTKAINGKDIDLESEVAEGA